MFDVFPLHFVLRWLSIEERNYVYGYLTLEEWNCILIWAQGHTPERSTVFKNPQYFFSCLFHTLNYAEDKCCLLPRKLPIQ